jgi:hypothetical protein
MRRRNWLNSTRTLGRRDVPDMCVKRLTIMQQSFDNDREDYQFDWTGDLWGQGQNGEYPDVGQLRIKSRLGVVWGWVICQVLDDNAFNNQLDEDEGFVRRSDNKVWRLRIMQQYTRRNNKRILDTDYSFNWNAGYVECRTSALYYMTRIEWGQYAGLENLLRILLGVGWQTIHRLYYIIAFLSVSFATMSQTGKIRR